MDLLRHVAFFVSVADNLHFGHAADDLGMAQPPLSQGIRRLESHLGVRLFDRDARRVALTPAGADLLPAARTLLADADAWVDAGQTWSDRSALRVGIPADLVDLCGPLMAGLARAGHQPAPLVAPSTELTHYVRHGQLDLAVVRHPGIVDGLLTGTVHSTDHTLTQYPTETDNHDLDIDITVSAPAATGPHAGTIGHTASRTAGRTGEQPDDGAAERPGDGAADAGGHAGARGDIDLDDLPGQDVRDLPVAVPPRRHHPPAHDQLVDSLTRQGHSGAVIEAGDSAQRDAYVTAGLACRLVADLGHSTEPGTSTFGRSRLMVPIRYRIVMPITPLLPDHLDAAALMNQAEELLP